MEIVKPVHLPVTADFVLSPEFFYGDYVEINFITNDDKYGRITFENLDAVKICRGEYLPYEFDYSLIESKTWVYQIENSKWQKERFDYENKYYGKAYEFGGNVNEMLTDFKHYLFSFHDQFIEVIARGFWFEKSDNNLFRKPLSQGHPFLHLPIENSEIMTAHALKLQIRKNPKSNEQLIHDAQFCSQKVFEFAMKLEEVNFVNHTVLLSYRDGNLISTLRSCLGRPEIQFDGLVNLELVKPFIKEYMKDVYERRKEMKKHKSKKHI